METRSRQWPSVVTTLRLLAAAFVLVALLIPRARAESAPIDLRAPISTEGGGSCGETEEVATVTCGAELARSFGEPMAISLLRRVGIELSEQLCRELLDDIWAEQTTCAGRGPDCGEMNTAAVPSPAPKLASSSTSAQVIWASLELGQAAARGLLVTDERPLASRDLPPPVPPPRLQA